MNYDKRSAEIKKVYEAQGKDPSGILELREIYSALNGKTSGDQVTATFSRLDAFGKKLVQFPELKPAYSTLRRMAETVINATAQIAKEANSQRLEEKAEVEAEAKKEISAAVKDKEKIRKSLSGKLLYAQLKNETDAVNYNALKEELNALQAKYDKLENEAIEAMCAEKSEDIIVEDRTVTIPENSRRFLLYQLANRLGDLIEQRKAEEAAKVGLPETDLDYLLNEAFAADDRAQKAEERAKAAENGLENAAKTNGALIAELKKYRALGKLEEIAGDKKNPTDSENEKARLENWNEFFRIYSTLKNMGRTEKTPADPEKELVRIKLELNKCLENIGVPADYSTKLIRYFVELTDFKYAAHPDGTNTPDATKKAFADQKAREQEAKDAQEKANKLKNLGDQISAIRETIRQHEPYTNEEPSKTEHGLLEMP